MQKPIGGYRRSVQPQKTRGGRSVLAQKTPKSMQFSIYKGAIDCSEQQCQAIPSVLANTSPSTPS
jgi:hypothetical protein